MIIYAYGQKISKDRRSRKATVQGIEIIIIHKGEQPRFEEELAKNILEIITVFSARLYGNRSHKNKQFMDKLNEAANELSKEDVTRPQN